MKIGDLVQINLENTRLALPTATFPAHGIITDENPVVMFTTKGGVINKMFYEVLYNKQVIMLGTTYLKRIK